VDAPAFPAKPEGFAITSEIKVFTDAVFFISGSPYGARHKSSAMGTRESRPPFLKKKPMERGLLPAFY
jgi:hypothetical protein